jgi:hypothetical protein
MKSDDDGVACQVRSTESHAARLYKQKPIVRLLACGEEVVTVTKSPELY